MKNKAEELMIGQTNQLVMQDNPRHAELLMNIKQLMSTNVVDWAVNDGNGHLVVKDTSEEMKDLIAAAHNARGFNQIEARDIIFKQDEENRMIARIDYTRGAEGSDFYEHSTSTINFNPIIKNLVKMQPLYEELQTKNKTLKTEMSNYLTNVIEDLKKDDHKAMVDHTKAMAAKFSKLSEQDILL